MGFRVEGLSVFAFRTYGFGFGVLGVGFLGLGGWGFGFRVEDLSLGFWVGGLGFWVEDLGLLKSRIQD